MGGLQLQLQAHTTPFGSSLMQAELPQYFSSVLKVSLAQ